VKRPPNQKCDDCQFEKCLAARFQMYSANPKNLGTYDPINHNSNWFVWDLVTSCGGDVQYNEFGWRGWNHPFYYFYGQMPDKP
jgi:hypothetical protein